MNSGQISASFEASVETGWFPRQSPVHSSVQIADALTYSRGDKTTQDRILGPRAKKTSVVASFSMRQRELTTPIDALRERRLNIGNFQRVLVADDHRGTRRMLLQMLRKWGFEAEPAASGAEVLEIVEQKRPPELIILSRMLPDVDAFELCRRLTDGRRDYSPYILVLGMDSDQHEVVRALEAGAAEYLTTPFEAQELRARLMVARRILKHQEKLVTSRDRFRFLAATDPLTGVWNRRSINQILREELNRAASSERMTGVLLIDLDHFKRVNDTHGHLAGDLVLRETSRRLKNILRPYDSIGRYGGEEFLIVAPDSVEEELLHLAERLRKTIEKAAVCVGESEIHITLSIGAAIAPPCESMLLSNVIAIADAALYDAKRSGRNRFAFGDHQLGQVMPLRTSSHS